MTFGNKEIINCVKDFDIIKGFKFKKEVMGFELSKLTTLGKYNIVVGYRGYPEDYYLYSPTAEIYFNNVENTLNEAFEKLKIAKSYGDRGTINKSLQDVNQVNYEIYNSKICDEFSCKKILLELRKSIELGAFPFFERYNSLEKVAELMASLNDKEQLNYISGFSRFLKLPLIYKLSGHINFLKCLNEFYSYMKEQSESYHVEHVRKSYLDNLKVFELIYEDDLK